MRFTHVRALAATLGLAAVAFASNAVASPPSLTWSVTADDTGQLAPVPQCSLNGYTMEATNTASTDLSIARFVNKLAVGVTYVWGSTTMQDVNTGIVTPAPDPTVNGNGELTWVGPFTAPANDSVLLHFSVTLPGPVDKKLHVHDGAFLRLSAGGQVRSNTQITLSRSDTSQCGSSD